MHFSKMPTRRCASLRITAALLHHVRNVFAAVVSRSKFDQGIIRDQELVISLISIKIEGVCRWDSGSCWESSSWRRPHVQLIPKWYMFKMIRLVSRCDHEKCFRSVRKFEVKFIDFIFLLLTLLKGNQSHCTHFKCNHNFVKRLWKKERRRKKKRKKVKRLCWGVLLEAHGAQALGGRPLGRAAERRENGRGGLGNHECRFRHPGPETSPACRISEEEHEVERFGRNFELVTLWLVGYGFVDL